MSLNAQTEDDQDIGSGSSESTDTNDETFDDWVEDPLPCKSLFDDVELPSVNDALKHDLEKHHFDLNEVSKRLSEYLSPKKLSSYNRNDRDFQILISIDELDS